MSEHSWLVCWFSSRYAADPETSLQWCNLTLHVYAIVFSYHTQVPEVYEAPDDAEVVASWDADTADQEESLTTGCMQESPAPTNENHGAVQNAASPTASYSPSRRKRKRPSSVLQDFMALHSRAEERAAENARESLQLRKELVELQKEANDINKNMAEIMKNYFASRQNKV
ncbi:hypothetical protein HPB49_013614 [Dermacentor silvarum]|uniref:Uncharacterized protein n=1 Tax=Dermacentor silvarum TaxID=543639 RepID=A0ACB8DPZ3_DERSI|nr:hypothetical protein HPB49_013614 [Dermacentor silvarum]